MVDPFEIVESSAGENGRTVRVRIPTDCPYFEGHFPGQPILPAIGQLELITTVLEKLGEPLRTIAAVDALRMSRPVGPGETLQLLLSTVEPDGRLRFTLTGEAGLVTRGSLVLRASD
jgi:3-hydroxyacyl-[acyl-carrier-protein] dehydratase